MLTIKPTSSALGAEILDVDLSREIDDRTFDEIVAAFLMWDNCSTQHRAISDYELPQRRHMERTTLRGAAPF